MRVAVAVICRCGREHGGHLIDVFSPLGDIDWEGDRCGPMVSALMEPGGAQAGHGPQDRADRRSRLHAVEDDETRRPTWIGRCAACGEHVRVRGDRLVAILDAWPGERADLAQLRRLTASR